MNASDYLTGFVGLLVGGDILATLQIKAKVAALATAMEKALTAQATFVTTQALQDQRIAHLEGEAVAHRVWREDITGFLQGIGYRKRDGP